MIAKRFFSLKKFFLEYGVDYVRSRDAKDLITKAHLYDLRPYLEEKHWSYDIDKNAAYTDKISAYWRITPLGLVKLDELFPELSEELDGYIVDATKKMLV